MEQYLRQLVSIAFTDKKEIFTGFLIDYSDDWILLKNNSIDFILDGFVILKAFSNVVFFSGCGRGFDTEWPR